MVQGKIENQKSAINNQYNRNLKSLCLNVSLRLKGWGFEGIDVKFDVSVLDFCFNNERLSIVPKGKKSIYSLAVSLELHQLAKENGLTNLNTIIIDSLWVASDIEGIPKEELAKKIITDINREQIQVLIFENEIDLIDQPDLNIIRI